MSQDIHDFAASSCPLLGLGEPTHYEPAFGRVRNELFARLADRGFRSIALEIDRVAALAVDDFVQGATGTIDAVMRDGFSHDWGEFDANRRLVAWMRDHNEGLAPEERLTFHGFDAPMETMSAPSPRRHLEYARDYLELDVDIAGLTGDDDRWSRTEAVLDAAMSPGDTPEAERLRVIADDMLTTLYVRAPERIVATSRAEWYRAKTYLTAGRGLLRYHKQCARRLERGPRISLLSATRDALMAENLLDIRDIESRRGATLVFSHNLHLQPSPSSMPAAGTDVCWFSAGAIVKTLLGEQYAFVAGSLGRSDAIALGEPDADTFEGLLQSRIATWGLTPASTVPSGRTRTDTEPRQGYFPLDKAILDTADAVLHVNDGATALE